MTFSVIAKSVVLSISGHKYYTSSRLYICLNVQVFSLNNGTNGSNGNGGINDVTI